METPQNQAPETTPTSAPASSNKMKPILGLVGVLAVAGIIGEIAIHQGNNPATTGSTGNIPPTNSTPGTYKDGTYTAQGDYQTHVGPEAVNITITLKNNVITDTQFQATPNADESQRYMDMFSQNYKTMVIGQNIDSVHLGKVSGSSLTPNGFNDALEKIKAQAKA